MAEIRLEATYNAPASTIYSALTNEVMLNAWLSEDTRNDVRENGFYHLYWTRGAIAAGIYRAVEADKRLVFSWFATGDPGETEIEATLEDAGGGTKLTVIQRGFGTGEAWENAFTAAKANWEANLENLRYFVESGLDRRIMMRPMLGILPGGLDDARKASHGLEHVSGGVFLTSVVAGGGAEKSGLLQHDVIVGLEGEEIRDFYAMSRVIARHQAGDTIPAVVWRGKDRLDVNITFGQRPIPELPPTQEALAAQVSAKIAAVKQELDDILREVPEAVYTYKPSATEWSLKEQLAHLIVAERANSYAYWMIIAGDSAYPFATNDSVQLAFGGCGYETGAELLDGVKRALDENAAIPPALPQAVLENRPLFLLLAFIMSFVGDHVRTHYDQMRQTIESAHAALGARA